MPAYPTGLEPDEFSGCITTWEDGHPCRFVRGPSIFAHDALHLCNAEQIHNATHAVTLEASPRRVVYFAHLSGRHVIRYAQPRRRQGSS